MTGVLGPGQLSRPHSCHTPSSHGLTWCGSKLQMMREEEEEGGRMGGRGRLFGSWLAPGGPDYWREEACREEAVL